MKNKIILGLMCIILSLSLISAADFTPQGNITLRNVYNIQNATSITIGNGTVHMNSSGFFGWLNWSWLQNIPGLVPYTGATQNVDLGLWNITATNLNGILNWPDLSNYPTQCTDYQVGVGDILTCGVWSTANNKITLSGENITAGTIGIARLPTLTDTHTHNALNITALSGFTNKILSSLSNITIDRNLNMAGKNITNVSYMNYQDSATGLDVWRTYYNGTALITEVV